MTLSEDFTDAKECSLSGACGAGSGVLLEHQRSRA